MINDEARIGVGCFRAWDQNTNWISILVYFFTNLPGWQSGKELDFYPSIPGSTPTRISTTKKITNQCALAMTSVSQSVLKKTPGQWPMIYSTTFYNFLLFLLYPRKVIRIGWSETKYCQLYWDQQKASSHVRKLLIV